MNSEQALGGPSLKSRMLKAAGWLIGGNIMSQALRLVSNLILTRLLLPEAFGLVAAVNTMYFALVMFSDLGIWQSVVRSKQGESPLFLGTAWMVQLLRGVLLCVVVLLIAITLHLGARAGWFIAGTVYADERLPLMMAVFSASALIQGLESMKLALAQRELKGGHLARLEISSQLLAMLVTLGLAAWTHSVWSLLVGTLVASAARTLMSHFYLPGASARPCWDKASASEIIGFGKWIFVSSIIGFMASNGEKIILGGTLSTQYFGVFSIASTLLAASIAVYGSLNAHVIFSSLSLAQRADKAEVVRVYTKVQQLADAFLAFFAGAICTSGQWAVWLLYDSRYHEAGWMLQWLGLTLLAIRHQVIEQYMFVHGQPAWVSANNILRTAALFILVPAGYKFAGAQGAIAGVVLSQFASWPLSLWFKHRHGLLTLASEVVWPPVLALGMLTGWLIHTVLRAWLGHH